MPDPQHLPDLAVYRRELISAGAPKGLPLVPCRDIGLLAELPAPPKGRHSWPWDRETPPLIAGGDWPTISIITPSFQQGAYLEETIRSVLLQNYPCLQFVIMDGGSTDDSAAIIERYRPWLSFARSAPDRGQAHALNLAFSLTVPEGLQGWLNSDDVYMPGALHAIARLWMRRQPRLIYGNGLSLDKATECLQLDLAGYPHPAFRRYPGILLSHATFWDGCLLEPFNELLFGALDYEFWVRLLPKAGRPHYLSLPLGTIRVHASAKSHDPKLQARWGNDATLNGARHPRLYGPDPVRRRLFVLTSRLVRRFRRAQAMAQANGVCRLAGWTQPITNPP